jgi:hypothetical protein
MTKFIMKPKVQTKHQILREVEAMNEHQNLKDHQI